MEKIRLGLIGCGKMMKSHAYAVDACTGKVAQGKVHLTVTAAKGKARHGALFRQRADGAVVGKDNTDNVHSTTLP